MNKFALWMNKVLAVLTVLFAVTVGVVWFLHPNEKYDVAPAGSGNYVVRDRIFGDGCMYDVSARTATGAPEKHCADDVRRRYPPLNFRRELGIAPGF
jgi:hypothetical protein